MQIALRMHSIYWNNHHPNLESLKGFVFMFQVDVASNILDNK